MTDNEAARTTFVRARTALHEASGSAASAEPAAMRAKPKLRLRPRLRPKMLASRPRGLNVPAVLMEKP